MSPRLLLALCALSFGCNHAAEEPGAPAKDAGSMRVDAAPGAIIDAGSEGGSDASGPACFTNPTTYLEIINACTDAQAIDKTTDLSPMSLPDGGLHPLP